MNEPTRLCMLESLNTDVLIAILASCDSFSDLASLIRASPTLLRAFLCAKASVLLHVVSNILGPATRDAALLAQTSLIRGEDRERQVDALVQDYRARLRVVSAPWVTKLDVNNVVALIRVTRLAEFFVDIFGSFRLRHFAHELDPARGNAPQPPLGRTERDRIAQAVLRCQLLVYIHEGIVGEPRDYYRFVRVVSSLFHPWEMEQVSEMDYFLGQFMLLLAGCEANSPGPPVRLYIWWKQNPVSLEEFAIKVKSLLDSESSLLDRVFQGEEAFSGQLPGICGFFGRFTESHKHIRKDPPHDLLQLASDVAAAASGMGQETSTSSQPWAWRDALQGHETFRWGMDLVKGPLPFGACRCGYSETRDALRRWRWFGMVFWDRERVEQLKQVDALKWCKSGWLVRRQDQDEATAAKCFSDELGSAPSIGISGE